MLRMHAHRRREFPHVTPHVSVLALATSALVLFGCPTSGVDAGAMDDAGSVDGGSAEDAGVDAGTDGGSLFEPFPVVDEDCEENGCIREVIRLGTVPQAVIEDVLDPGVTIENGYEIFLVRYFTSGREARVTITIPWPMAAPDGGFHVVVNNPGTVGIADACALGDNIGGPALAGYFGAYGMIGAAPDYPGLGTDGLHPYLVADIEGKASLDAAKATLSLARLQLVGISRRVAIVGLSQGGHASLAAAALHASYQSSLDVRAFAASAPGSVSLADWAAGVVIPGPHMLYHALVMYAFADHYGHTGAEIFVPPFRDDVDLIMNTACTYSETEPTLDDLIPDDAALVFDPAFLADYESADLSSYPALAQGFEENRIDAFTQTAPLLIYQGTDDVTVPQFMTDALVARLVAGGVDVDYRLEPGGTHTSVAFGFVAFAQSRAVESRAWIREKLDAE